jgi:hypothetical protein
MHKCGRHLCNSIFIYPKLLGSLTIRVSCGKGTEMLHLAEVLFKKEQLFWPADLKTDIR